MNKKYLRILAASMTTIFLTACNMGNEVKIEINNENGDSAVEASADSITNKADEESAGNDIEQAADDADAIDGDEVWTMISGTYFFWDSEEGRGVSVTSYDGENHMNVGEEEYAITISKAGEIVAVDGAGKEVFRGAMYNGGNTLRGVYKGKKINVSGSGD